MSAQVEVKRSERGGMEMKESHEQHLFEQEGGRREQIWSEQTAAVVSDSASHLDDQRKPVER